MKRRFTKTFITAIMIMVGMTACGQKKNVTTDDVSEKDCSTGSDSTGNYNTGDYNRKRTGR